MLQLRQPADDMYILVLPPYQGCGYEKLLAELC